MQVETFREVKALASVKWREYRDAEKKTQGKEPIYGDLKKMYWHIMHGKALCDIAEVIKAGGVHDNHHPKLAICCATSKKVNCEYYQSGKVRFIGNNVGWRDKMGFVELTDALPTYRFSDGNGWRSLTLEAPVPMIPPNCRPEVLTDQHFILWEVDKWEMIPPTDPYLLRRITKNIFVVEAQWDLTPLEKAAMAGRMH